jgi:hypothetical protein
MQKATTYFKERHPLLGNPFLLSVFLALILLLRGTSIAGSDHQKSNHDMAHNVMPFDISKTTHIFEMTETGGIQQVIAKDTINTEQISLIREHLRHEAARFRNGDFSDPASLHGASMPGLKELAAGSSKMSIEYSDISSGGQIVFTTHDIHLLTAVHRWFGAQLSEHGADATYR